MAENGGVGIGDGAQDALRLVCAGKSQVAVNARNDEVETCEDFDGIVERAVGQDVRLDPFEYPEIAVIAPVQAVDLGVLRLDLLGRRPCA
jgi:hypothetical protein